MNPHRNTYGQYFCDDEAATNIPRTSNWRIRKRLRLESDSENGQLSGPPNSSTGQGDIDSCPDLPESLSGMDNDYLFPTGCEVNTEQDQEEPEINSQPNISSDDVDDVWWTNDDSIWYDAQEDLSGFENITEAAAEEDSDPVHGDRPIYHGASLSVSESAVLILTFVLRHNLNGECLSDLLTLISLHCLTTNILYKSLFKFRSFFSDWKSPLVIHTYCKTCEMLIKSSDSHCPVCQKDMKEKGNTSYFVEIPLLNQLQQLFNRPGFHKLLLHRFDRIHDGVSDIYDGELYQRYSKPGQFLASTNNISFMWYTDGVPMFKSSKVSIWPLFFAINELPREIRFKSENLIFAGLWFGSGKPAMTCFMKPFYDSIKSIYEKGVDLLCCHCSKTINVKACLLCGTCDLPAKCMVLNMTQFNGKHGCATCLQEGTVTKTGKGHTRTFPFIDLDIDGPRRNHQQFIEHGVTAHQDGKPCFGVKGPSWWANCTFDIINGTAIDYMHCVLLGITRKLLSLWFNPKFNGQEFSVSSKTSVADQRLESILPPHYIQRHPRDIKEQSKYWKASECKAWLFYYSIPVMFGILTDPIFSHYLLLCEAIYILNLDVISDNELQHAENLIYKFCGMFASLYGDEHMSANIHQLLHIPGCVRHLGPLWVYSCFSFESVNGKLVHLFHGTQNPVMQISNAVTTMMQMPLLSEQLINGSLADTFYKKMTRVGHHFKTTEKICENCYAVGSIVKRKLDVKYIQCISDCFQMLVGDCFAFQRLYSNKILYHSKMYTTHKRNSCTVKYIVGDGHFCGIVMFYLKAKPVCYCSEYCKCLSVYCAIIQKISKDAENPFVTNGNEIKAKLQYVYTGQLSDQIIAVPITDIIGLGVCMKFGNNRCCVIFPPNFVESD